MPKTVGITHIVPMPLIILTNLIALTIPIIHLGGKTFDRLCENEKKGTKHPIIVFPPALTILTALV